MSEIQLLERSLALIGSGEVAQRAGVSRSHVSNYFNHPERVSPEVTRRIAEAISSLGYVRNESARRLRSGANRQLGVILLDAWSPYFSEVSTGAEDEADEHGWTVHVLNSRRDPERESRHIAFLEGWRFPGFLIVPERPQVDRLEALARRGITPVLLDPPHAHPRSTLLPIVEVDHLIGGSLAAAHLVESGGRRFAYVGNPHTVRHAEDRLSGFSTRLRESGVSSPVRLIETAGMEVRDGTAAAHYLIDLPAQDRPDAVFTANDVIAFGLVHGLLAAGVRIPDDIRVVGYDDVAMAAQLAIPLTTIRQPSALIGATAARLAIKLIEGERMRDVHIVLQPELVVRQTS